MRTAVNAGVFTPVVLQMIVVGEESGALDEMLEEIGDMYQRETEYELKALGSQIEPILIVVLGVMVLIVALGYSCRSGTWGAWRWGRGAEASAAT